jgi:hypothetical protein
MRALTSPMIVVYTWRAPVGTKANIPAASSAPGCARRMTMLPGGAFFRGPHPLLVEPGERCSQARLARYLERAE